MGQTALAILSQLLPDLVGLVTIQRLPGLNVAYLNLPALLEVYKMWICSNLIFRRKSVTYTPLRKIGIDIDVLFDRPLVRHLLSFCVHISLPCPTPHFSPIQQSLEVLVNFSQIPTHVPGYYGCDGGKQNAYPCATSAAANLCNHCYGNRRLRYE